MLGTLGMEERRRAGDEAGLPSTGRVLLGALLMAVVGSGVSMGVLGNGSGVENTGEVTGEAGGGVVGYAAALGLAGLLMRCLGCYQPSVLY